MDIKELRKMKNLTQQELADKCGVTVRTVQNWEQGKTIPDSVMLLLKSFVGDEIVSSNPKKERFTDAFNYLRKRGLAHTQKDIAEKMGSTQPNVSAALKGVESVLTDNFLYRFNTAYGNIFSLSWLLKGEGEMLNNKGADISILSVGKEYHTILLPQSAMGGSLVEFGADGVFPENCERVISPIADVDFAITIYGDSMIPEYPPGSRAMIKKIDPNAFIVWGCVYVLDTCNGVIVKELQPSQKEGSIVCHSHNPNGRYKDFEVNLTDVRGIYRVLACITAK